MFTLSTRSNEVQAALVGGQSVSSLGEAGRRVASASSAAISASGGFSKATEYPVQGWLDMKVTRRVRRCFVRRAIAGDACLRRLARKPFDVIWIDDDADVASPVGGGCDHVSCVEFVRLQRPVWVIVK
jgi:hypothetical protein